MSLPLGAQYTSVTAATTAAAKVLLAAKANSRIRILGLSASAVAAQRVTIQSSTGLAYVGPLYLAAGVPAVLPPTAIGYAETNIARGLYMQLDGAQASCVNLIYTTRGATA
jgi:hypothetical protein